MQDPRVHYEIIEAALNRCEEVAGTRPGCSVERWRTDRIERKHSTVYRLTDPLTGVRMFYKVFQDVRDEEPDTPDSLANRLARAQVLSDKLIEETSRTAISPTRVLAVDTDRRTIVTLGMEGREIRRLTLKSLVLGKHMSSTHARLVGEACVHIERCSGDPKIGFDWDRFSRQIDHRLNRSDTDQHNIERLRELVMVTASRILAERNPIYVHGDLSPTNILLSDNEISLIDFSWFTGFKGFDVGLFCYRLRSMEKLWAGRGPELRQAVMAGYEEAAGSSYDLPSLDFVNLLLLVRGLGGRPSQLRDMAREHLQRHGAHTTVSDGRVRWWWERVDK